MRLLFRTIAVATAVLALAGCGTGRPDRPDPAHPGAYIIQIGDQLAVDFVYQNRSLSTSVTNLVDKDGAFALLYDQKKPVAGRSITDVNAALGPAYGEPPPYCPSIRGNPTPLRRPGQEVTGNPQS